MCNGLASNKNLEVQSHGKVRTHNVSRTTLDYPEFVEETLVVRLIQVLPSHLPFHDFLIQQRLGASLDQVNYVIHPLLA